MKVKKLVVREFRQFGAFALELPPDGGIVCLTGENGVGKSSLLRLIAEGISALSLGGVSESLTPTFDGESIDFDLWLDFTDEPVDVYRGAAWVRVEASIDGEWDGIIGVRIFRTIQSGQHFYRTSFYVGSYIFINENANEIVQAFSAWFDSLGSLKFLSIDANRAYLPDVTNRWGQGLYEQLQQIGGKKAAAALSAVDKYHQWVAYSAEADIRALLEARERARHAGVGEVLLEYSDPLQNLNEIVNGILPHLRVLGVDPESRAIRLESHEKIIPFHSLSGGEREVVFLSAMVDRLSVTNGILVIDEPELHLHSDMVRRLIQVVSSTVTGGQIWFSTHSYEAVEAAGYDHVYLIMRDADGASKLESLPPIGGVGALIAALGVPAVSLAGRKFVLVEGGKAVGERARFEALCGNQEHVRFVPIGSTKKDVIKNFDILKSFGESTDDQLVFSAVVDSDFDSLPEVGTESPNGSVFQLGLHEVENLYLDPAVWTVLAAQIGANDLVEGFPDSVIELSDRWAGSWIWNRAQYFGNSQWKEKGLLGSAAAIRGGWMAKDWSCVVDQSQNLLASAQDASSDIADQLAKSIERYRELRESTELWKHCLGKEVFHDLSRMVEITPSRLERMIWKLWDTEPLLRPAALNDLRAFVSGKSADTLDVKNGLEVAEN